VSETSSRYSRNSFVSWSRSPSCELSQDESVRYIIINSLLTGTLAFQPQHSFRNGSIEDASETFPRTELILSVSVLVFALTRQGNCKEKFRFILTDCSIGIFNV
jgi:hypothetical protein